MKASVKQYAQVNKGGAAHKLWACFSVPSEEEENLGKILILNRKVFANRHEGRGCGHLVNTARALMEKSVGNLPTSTSRGPRAGARRTKTARNYQSALDVDRAGRALLNHGDWAEPVFWQFGPPTEGGRPFTKSGRFK